jgi:hypothetical protein
MVATHLELLVEEPSMEAFLHEILPKIVGERATFTIHPHQGKHHLLRRLPDRLRGYSRWLPNDARIVVRVDRDDDDCLRLKHMMEQSAAAAGLCTRTAASGGVWQVVNRIAVEELEAWFFGAWASVRAAYPRVARTINAQAAYRRSDEIKGGTWEALEHILTCAGYFSLGIRKTEVAGAIGRHMRIQDNASPSFHVFHAAVLEAVSPLGQVGEPA